MSMDSVDMILFLSRLWYIEVQLVVQASDHGL